MFDGADVEDVVLWEPWAECVSELGFVVGGGCGPELVVAALVDYGYFVGVDVVVVDYVAFGALADCYYAVGVLAGVLEFVVVD